MGKLPRRSSGRTGFDDVKITFAVLMALALVGCSNLPKDGRYQTGGGGWDNFRANAGEAHTERST